MVEDLPGEHQLQAAACFLGDGRQHPEHVLHGVPVAEAVAFAEAWGTAPWEIEDAPGAIPWLKRFSTYHKALARAKKIANAKPPED